MSDPDKLFRYMLSQVLRAGDVRLLPIINDIPDEYAAPVGRIMATWSQVEWAVKSSVYPLLGVTAKEGRVAVRDPRLEDQIKMIQQLLSLRELTIKSDLPAVQKQLAKVSPYRDLLAHGLWMRDENNKLYVQNVAGTWQPDKGKPTVSRRIKPQGVEIDPSDLNNILELMRATLRVVDTMNAEIVRVAASSPRRWPPQSSRDRPPDDPKKSIP